MKNYINDGEDIVVVAPAGGTVSGSPVLIGAALFGVAVNTVAAGANVGIKTEGHFTLAKAAVTIVAGDKAYWDNTAKLITNVSTSNTLVGVFTAAATSGDATARANLTGQV
jgi:predicted RecA/RadA family phage recombinase